MINLNKYLGFCKIAAKLKTTNDASPVTGAKITDYTGSLTRSEVTEMLPYFKETLESFFNEKFPESISIDYHNINVDGEYLMGVSIRYKDIDGCLECYIVRVIENCVQLIGIPSDIMDTNNVGPINHNKGILDMNKGENNVIDSDPYIRNIVEKDYSERSNGLRQLVIFNCEVTRGDDMIRVYCQGRITLAADSLFGILYNITKKEEGALDPSFITKVKVSCLSTGILDTVEAFKVLSPEEYLTLWYGITENTSYDDAHGRAMNQLAEKSLIENLCIKTIDGVLSTLYYNVSNDSFFIGPVEEVDNKVLAIMTSPDMLGRDVFIIDNAQYLNSKEIFKDPELVGEGLILPLGKNVSVFKKNKYGLFACEAAEAVKNNLEVKEDPADKAKVQKYQVQGNALVANMNKLTTDAEKDNYYSNKVSPFIKDVLLMASTIGFLMYPVAFGIVSYVILSYITLVGIDKFKNKVANFNATIDGTIAKLKGKTDNKSMAFVAQLTQLKNSVTTKLKAKKEDEELKDDTKEMIKESLFIELVKKDMFFSHIGSVVNTKQLIAEGSFGDKLTKAIFGFDMDHRIQTYLDKIKNADRHLINGASEFTGAPEDFYVKFDALVNPILAAVIELSLLFFLVTGFATNPFITAGLMSLIVFLGIKGDCLHGLILEVLDSMAIYIGYEKNGRTTISSKFNRAKETLNKEDIELLDSLRDKVKKDPKLQEELREKDKAIRENIETLKEKNKDAKVAENLDLSKYNILMCEGMVGLSSNEFANPEFLHKITYIDIMYMEASVAEVSDKIFEAMKGMPRQVYTKYKEYLSRMKSYISKIKQARDDEEREEILNKEFIPAYERFLNLLLTGSVAIILVKLGLINPIIGILGVCLGRVISNFTIKEKKKRALAILRNEQKIAEEALGDAKSDNNREAKFAIMKVQDKIGDMLTSLETRF